MVPGFLKRLLLSTGHTDLQPDDARAAIAAVLVMAARADGHYDASEQAMIDTVLMKRFKVDKDKVRGLREEGEAAESEAIDIFQFSRAIKAAIPIEERIAVLEELWAVILADGVRDPHEDTLMRMITDRLGLSDRDSALARQKAQGS